MLNKLISERPAENRFAFITSDEYSELVINADQGSAEFIKIIRDGLDTGREDLIAIVRSFYVLIEDEQAKKEIEEALNNLDI